MNERYYTINEVTQMFGVTRTTVYEWMNQGKLKFVIIGARRRFTQQHIDAFIRAGEQADTVEVETQKNEAPGLAQACAA